MTLKITTLPNGIEVSSVELPIEYGTRRYETLVFDVDGNEIYGRRDDMYAWRSQHEMCVRAFGA